MAFPKPLVQTNLGDAGYLHHTLILKALREASVQLPQRTEFGGVECNSSLQLLIGFL